MNPSSFALLIALLLSLTMSQFSGAQEASSNPPMVPAKAVGNPEFECKDKKFGAGTAALVRLPDGSGVVVLTVRHLFGPMGGLSRKFSAEELPDYVESIRLESLWSGSFKSKVKAELLPVVTKGSPLDDLAVLRIEKNNASDVLEFAEKPAVEGDVVWIVAAPRQGGAKDQKLFRAVLLKDGEGGWMDALFDDTAVKTSGMSGAPVLNADGKVVGIYSGHWLSTPTARMCGIRAEDILKALNIQR